MNINNALEKDKEKKEKKIKVINNQEANLIKLNMEQHHKDQLELERE